MSQVDPLPELLLAPFKGPEGFGFPGAVFQAAFGAKNLDEPGVGFTGCQPFHFQPHRHLVAVEDLDAALARFGRIDALVNNAGWDKVEPFVSASEATWDKVLAINLRGPIAVTRAVLDGMIERRAGWIVSISSDAGRVGSSGEVVYSAAKAGVIGFSKALAREVARHQIHVNVVCPGPTNTPLLAQVGADNPNLVQSLAKAIPFRRIGEPDDIASAVAFLVSDDAAFITGQTLSVSGGMTMA
jgi:2-hydroxycyclohexanecarboxyl-CoA dehydrogenase